MASSPKIRALLVLSSVLLAAGLLLAPLLDGRFLTDDFQIFRTIAFRPEPGGDLLAVTPRPASAYGGLLGQRFSDDHDVYRPTVIMGLAAQYLLSGIAPAPIHRVNLAIHLLGGLFAWLLLRRLVPKAGLGAAALATALFLISPLQLEAITWSSARSDTQSWLFGAAALWLRFGGDGTTRRLLAAVLALVAVGAKESAVVFVAILGVCDLVALLNLRRQGKNASPWRWILPHVATVALYLFGRAVALGGLGLSYDGRGSASLASSDASDLLASAHRVFAPFAEGIATEAATPWISAGRIALGVGWLLVIAGFFRSELRSKFRARTILVMAALLLVPFLLSVGINAIGATLANSRGGYTSWAILAMLAGLGISALPRPLALVGSLALLVPLAAASRPTQALYLEAHHGVEHTLGSIRTALQDVPDSVQDIVIIGYREDDYFRGSFGLSGSMNQAMSRPFCSRDWRLLLVRSDDERADRPYLYPFRKLAERRRGRAAWLHLRRGSVRPRSYDFAHDAGWPASGGPSLEPISPAPGDSVIINPQAGEVALNLRWRSDFAPDTRWRLRLFSRLARLTDLPLPPEIVQRDGDILSTPVYWDEQLRQFLEWHTLFAWTVVPCAPDGTPLTPAPPTFFEARRQ